MRAKSESDNLTQLMNEPNFTDCDIISQSKMFGSFTSFKLLRVETTRFNAVGGDQLVC